MDFVHRGREDQLTLGSRVPTGTTCQLVNYLFSAKLNIARACVGNSQFLELKYI
ncbi:hypothetical protein T03_10265 [Trichinella britovi]|uniref:Uncharacterized protein n=1 Tax=Trichinella britovi TaxID=45882 RepID=A0A0V1AII2_TRIBR|nr:hypothetical protein T03_10265 [Trichinella britovi]